MQRKLHVSVIIPTHNRKNCVMNAVDSVLSQDNSNIDFEVVVSDDGSTDGTKELFKINNPRVQYFYNPKNKGVNAARNLAIKKAKGEYLLLLDSDDMLTSDTAEIIFQARNKLGRINFFGTADVKNGKKLYSLTKEGNISYREWLENKKLRGEFDPIIHKSVFKNALFDEDRFCFEGFFWNKAVKKHGLVAFDKVIRLYSFEQENRVSKKLLLPAYAAKRYDDYKRYVKEFGPDYRKLKLERKLSEILNTLSIYAMLSGDTATARKANSEATELSATPTTLFLRIVYLFGPGFFRVLYGVALRFKTT